MLYRLMQPIELRAKYTVASVFDQQLAKNEVKN